MKNYNKKVCVVGLGYIGLPTSALLANKGYAVSGVDIDPEVVEIINQGNIHIVEPDLDSFVRSAVDSGNLIAYIEPQISDIYIICVPTPFYKDLDIPLPNLEYVENATDSISSLVKPGDVIILESTSPIGTTNKIKQILEKKGVDIDLISIAYCPERVLPGNIMNELIANDRIIGGISKESTDIVSEFYETFVTGKVLKTSAETAEMCKLAENSFRDINIAFANELSMMCSKNGVNVWDLIKLANHHPRVNILQPGTGVGGHCIAVDPWFLVAGDPENSKLIKSAREVNSSKPSWVVNKIIEVLEINKIPNKKLKVACLGLAFKPDIDDLRESPAVEVVQKLINNGIEVLAVEPNINQSKEFTLTSLDIAIEESDLCVILVKHSLFEEESIKDSLIKCNAIDFCGSLQS